MRILLAEDENDLREVIAKRLKAQGYGVDSASDGEAALEYWAMAEYDLLILDIMMPKTDGLKVLQTIRAQGSIVPVLLLTAKDSTSDRVMGLDLGADDYLVKPFDFEELLARIRTLLRRYSPNKQDQLILGDLVMTLSTRTVRRGDMDINLSAKEFAILEYMLRNQGIVISRSQLENHVWDYDTISGSNVVDVYIRYLRRKIDDPFAKKLLHTIRGAGYVLREEV